MLAAQNSVHASRLEFKAVAGRARSPLRFALLNDVRVAEIELNLGCCKPVMAENLLEGC